MRIRVYECLEDDPPKNRFVALVFYDGGALAPVLFARPTEAGAHEAAQSWYDAELARAAKASTPRAPKPQPAPAAPEPEEEAF